MNIFIDTTNWKLIYILEKDNQIIDQLILENNKKISDIAIEQLKELLAKNNLTIQDIKNFYVTQGPGSYTGVRVGLTIVKTLKVLNNDINVFLMNSLQFQAGNKKVISCLDARSNKFYAAVFDNNTELTPIEVISLDEIESLQKQYSGFEIIKDYENIDFSKNFLDTKQYFLKIEDIEQITPLYIKNFI